jgi:RNA polymerase sigma factor (sigma-70 family)
LDESLLIQACVANDRKAQFALYQKHFAFVSGICLRYLKDEGLAREVTNDVFLKAFTKMGTFDSNKASLLTWLRVIAVNTCLDKLKLKSFENHHLPLTEDTAAAELVYDAEITTADLLHILGLIPQKQSVIFNLFVVEGYSHEEIGKMLNISAGNSRWYLNDAKQRIKKLMIETGFTV